MEIEKKYLCDNLDFDIQQYKHSVIKQCYISTKPTIRLRQFDDKYILTVKGAGNIAREEFELELTLEEYNNLLKKVETPVLEKVRYYIPINDKLTAELDIYKGQLEGLKTVEVEFKSIDDAEYFKPPYWFGKDVSSEKKYKNSNLSLSIKNP